MIEINKLRQSEHPQWRVTATELPPDEYSVVLQIRGQLNGDLAKSVVEDMHKVADLVEEAQ